MKIMTQTEVAEFLRCKRSKLFKLRRDPDFPAPVLGELKWLDKDIYRYVERSKGY